jgi:hypothetical protein
MNRLSRTARAAAALAALLWAGACGEADEETVAAPPSAASDATTATPAPPPAEPTAAADERRIPSVQLDAMVAPIALYPDALLMQVLMASTYTTEIVMADRWRQQHLDLTGESLDKALAEQSWDPSVSSLTFFPDVLHRMSENLEWTTDLGNAFLNQQVDVLDACQRMRRLAHAEGTLKTTKEQTVVVEKEIVTIEPADPEVVYVPQYNTTTAYGSTYQPPPQYYPEAQTGYSGTDLAMTGILAFGAGMLTSYALWGDCDWDDHDVYYHGHGHGHGGGGGPSYRYGHNIGGKGDDTININVGGNQGRQQWTHSPQHRRGVAYTQPRTRDRYASKDPRQTRFDESRVRGYDRGTNLGTPDRGGSGAGGRPGRPGPGSAPGMPARPKDTPTDKMAAPRDRPTQAKAAQPRKQAKPTEHKAIGGKGAFDGSRNAGLQRESSQRGAASRGRGGGASGGGRQGDGRQGGGGKKASGGKKR